MHKVRASAAREQVLHDDFNTNPFAKKRKPSIYPEPDEDEGQKPPDPENFVAELVRRGTRKLSFAKRENVNNRTNKRNFKKPGSGQSSAQLQSIDEEKPAHLYEEPASDVQESRAITWRHKAFLTWRQWRIYIAKIGLGNQWRIKPAIAGITRSTIAVAPLSATGHYFLPAAPRPSQAVVIEYQNGQLGKPMYRYRLPAKRRAHLFSGPNRAPVFRFSGQTEHSHVSGKEFSGLKDLTDEVGLLLRILYVLLTSLT